MKHVFKIKFNKHRKAFIRAERSTNFSTYTIDKAKIYIRRNDDSTMLSNQHS